MPLSASGTSAQPVPPGGGIFKTAAVEVLRHERRLMTTGEITKHALQRGLLRAQGKTPEATMASALYTDVKRRTGQSVFTRPQEGLFGLKAWIEEGFFPDGFFAGGGPHVVCDGAGNTVAVAQASSRRRSSAPPPRHVLCVAPRGRGGRVTDGSASDSYCMEREEGGCGEGCWAGAAATGDDYSGEAGAAALHGCGSGSGGRSSAHAGNGAQGGGGCGGAASGLTQGAATAHVGKGVASPGALRAGASSGAGSGGDGHDSDSGQHTQHMDPLHLLGDVALQEEQEGQQQRRRRRQEQQPGRQRAQGGLQRQLEALGAAVAAVVAAEEEEEERARPARRPRTAGVSGAQGLDAAAADGLLALHKAAISPAPSAVQLGSGGRGPAEVVPGRRARSAGLPPQAAPPAQRQRPLRAACCVAPAPLASSAPSLQAPDAPCAPAGGPDDILGMLQTMQAHPAAMAATAGSSLAVAPFAQWMQLCAATQLLGPGNDILAALAGTPGLNPAAALNPAACSGVPAAAAAAAAGVAAALHPAPDLLGPLAHMLGISGDSSGGAVCCAPSAGGFSSTTQLRDPQPERSSSGPAACGQQQRPPRTPEGNPPSLRHAAMAGMDDTANPSAGGAPPTRAPRAAADPALLAEWRGAIEAAEAEWGGSHPAVGQAWLELARALQATDSVSELARHATTRAFEVCHQVLTQAAADSPAHSSFAYLMQKFSGRILQQEDDKQQQQAQPAFIAGGSTMSGGSCTPSSTSSAGGGLLASGLAAEAVGAQG